MADSGSGEVSPHGFEIAIFSLYPYVEQEISLGSLLKGTFPL